MLRLSIKKEQLSHFDKALFDGKIEVIDNDSDVAFAINTINNSRVIGIDTETRPSFKKGVEHAVSLLQISTLDVCYLFRLNKVGITQHIISLFENKDIIKVGLSLRDDLRMMHKIANFKPESFIDLQAFVKDYGIIDNSLQKIYAIIFGKKISKGQRLSNWEADNLTEFQQRYAATDAWACIMIYNELTSQRFKPDHSPFVYIEENEE